MRGGQGRARFTRKRKLKRLSAKGAANIKIPCVRFRSIADIAECADTTDSTTAAMEANLQWQPNWLGFLVANLAFIPTPAPAANPPSAIEGKWVSECLPLGKNGRHGLIIRVIVSPNDFKASGQMYARNICDAPIIAFEDKAVVEGTEAIPTGWKLRLKLVSATITINDRSVANIYAQGKKCGLASWQVDVPVHVDGRTCEPVSYPSKGAMLAAEAHTSRDGLVVQNLSTLLGAKASDGVTLPQDVEFRRE